VNKDRLVILGGGGHAKVVVELIAALGKFEIQGIIDPNIEAATKVLNVPVLGSDDLLASILAGGTLKAVVAVGSTGDNRLRRILFEKLIQLGFSVPVLIHPHAHVSPSALFSPGVQVMAGAIVQAGTSVAHNTILNTGSITEHDCTIGRHVHLCPGAVLSGGCTVGDNAFIGAGATVIQQIRIGKGAVVGAGAVVIRDVAEASRVSGIPARGPDDKA
jgi:sugar O-acyltransferase (sialic acid O-acetyltransferase NeuD family)